MRAVGSIGSEMTHARTCMRAARLLPEHEDAHGCANRLYYCVFHCARALITDGGHAAKSHVGLLGTFGLHFVRTGRFSESEGRLYKSLMDLRQDADYGVFVDVALEETRALLPAVAAFLAKAEALLGR